jgi:hypothetical protein
MAVKKAGGPRRLPRTATEKRPDPIGIGLPETYFERRPPSTRSTVPVM